MSRFEDLPLDIICEIVGTQVAKADLYNLRLVSRCFNTLICPILFATLNLDFKDITGNQPDFTRCQNIVTALADGSTTICKHTLHLKFDALRIYTTYETEVERVCDVQRLVLDRIFDAISALKKLQTINFYVSSSYPEQLTVEIIRALATLTSFKGFDKLILNTNPPSSFTLTPLSNLTIFRISWEGRADNVVSDIASLLSRCPDLSELYLANDSSSLHELFAQLGKLEKEWKLNELQLNEIDVRPDDIKMYARHFKNLSGLEIRHNPSPTAATDFGTICDALWREQGVLLKRVSTDYMEDPLLLRYLDSYSGLTKLCFGAKGEFEVPKGVGEDIYGKILPRHAETLEEYQLYAGLGWSEFLTEVQRAGLVKCQRLRVLQVNTSLPWQRLLRIDSDGSNKFFSDYYKTRLEMWLEVGLDFANLERLELRPQRISGRAFASASIYSRIQSLKEVIERYRKTRGMKFLVNNL